jgi:hypothetical protein
MKLVSVDGSPVTHEADPGCLNQQRGVWYDDEDEALEWLRSL